MNCTVMLEPRRGGRKKPNYFDHLFPDPERWLKKAEPSIEQPGLFRPPFRGWSKKAEKPLPGFHFSETDRIFGNIPSSTNENKVRFWVTWTIRTPGTESQRGSYVMQPSQEYYRLFFPLLVVRSLAAVKKMMPTRLRANERKYTDNTKNHCSTLS